VRDFVKFSDVNFIEIESTLENLTHNFQISVYKFKLNPNLFLYFYTFLVAKMAEQRVELRTIFIPFKEVNTNIQR
jgi:hypothetical protein